MNPCLVYINGLKNPLKPLGLTLIGLEIPKPGPWCGGPVDKVAIPTGTPVEFHLVTVQQVFEPRKNSKPGWIPLNLHFWSTDRSTPPWWAIEKFGRWDWTRSLQIEGPTWGL